MGFRVSEFARVSVFLAAIVSIFLVAAPTLAQEEPAEEETESKSEGEERKKPTMESISAEEKEDFVRFVEAGKESYSDGKFEDAIPFFKKAYDIVPRPELHYRIALSYERAGNDEKAIEYYEKFLEEKPDTSKRGQVEATIERLRKEQEEETDTVDSAPKPTPGGIAGKKPNLVYVELAGHGVASTINYERYLLFDVPLGSKFTFNFAAGLGIGHNPDGLDLPQYSFNGAVNSLPVFATATFLGDVHSMVVQGGVVIFGRARTDSSNNDSNNTTDGSTDQTDSTDGSGSSSGGGVNSGLQRQGELIIQSGYQLQHKSGFLFRATVTLSSAPTLLPGLTFGWSF